jgi:hypothetical protein
VSLKREGRKKIRYFREGFPYEKQIWFHLDIRHILPLLSPNSLSKWFSIDKLQADYE